MALDRPEKEIMAEGSKKSQSGVESLLRAVERLQDSVLSGHRDSIEIDPEKTRQFDELDVEFGAAHNLRSDIEDDYQTNNLSRG